MPDSKKVALLIETSTSYGRTLIRGIVQYANVAASWIFYNEPRGLLEKLPQLSKWKLDGIIMRDTPENMPLLKLNIPAVVSIRYEKSVEGVPNIISDSSAIGIVAAQYLRDKGFNRFAFCGFDDMPWSKEREHAFVAALKGTENISVYRPRQPKPDYNQELNDMAQWLKSLQKPNAVMACNDVRGANVIEACKLAQIKIPQEISILGVNNDDMICEMTSPPLSSVSLDIITAGYEAAKTLDRMMKGKSVHPGNIVIKPKMVITRASTDILAIDDPDISAALHYISQNSKKHIQVSDVAANVGINRRSLERRFRQTIGKSVYDEIKRVRIDVISKMLIETDLPVSEIAYNMGFEDANHISRYFTATKGVSPLKYRKTYTIHP